ncbi:transposase [Achromobacter xylosoxidans]|uniref:transposase n=1 Tax=Alcaligenes xylosoxydans xylosoxydans TaxID=85698 RepID=UPI003BA962BB
MAVVDDLKDLTDAIGTAFQRTTMQNYIVHLIRNGRAMWNAVARALTRVTASRPSLAFKCPAEFQ